mgnify:CR=1 FL=1
MPMIGLLLPPLNDKNLPWLDVIHPIVVHFVIAMALITVVFDLIGVLTRRRNLFEVSFWNLLVATVAIFVAIIFGQIEAGFRKRSDAAGGLLFTSNELAEFKELANEVGQSGWGLENFPEESA